MEAEVLKVALSVPFEEGFTPRTAVWDVGWVLPSQGLRGVEEAARGELCREQGLPGDKIRRNDVPGLKGGP